MKATNPEAQIPIPVNELEGVEKTKHLVPNLAILAKALFGENSCLIPKAPYQLIGNSRY